MVLSDSTMNNLGNIMPYLVTFENFGYSSLSMFPTNIHCFFFTQQHHLQGRVLTFFFSRMIINLPVSPRDRGAIKTINSENFN